MAVTLQDAGGFCDGAGYQLAHRENAGPVARPAWWWQPAERAIYRVANVGIGRPYTVEVTPGSDWITQSINVAFEDITTDPSSTLFLEGKTSGGVCWRMNIESGNVKLYDATNALIGTVASGISAQTAYRVTVKWKLSDSSAIRVWWNGAASYHGSPAIDATGKDLNPGSGTGVKLSLENGFDQSHAGLYVYCGAWTVRTDDGAAIDTNDTRQYPVFERQYRHDITTATPDIGDAVDSGTWDLADEIPVYEANEVIYTATTSAKDAVCTSDDSSEGGPAGDAAANGRTWLRAYWVWRWKAVQGSTFLPRAKWYGNYGAHSSPTTDGTVATPQQSGTGDWQTYKVQQWSDGAQFPASNEYMQQGFGTPGHENDGAVEVADMWCGLVIEYAGPAAKRRVCIDGLVTEWVA